MSPDLRRSSRSLTHCCACRRGSSDSRKWTPWSSRSVPQAWAWARFAMVLRGWKEHRVGPVRPVNFDSWLCGGRAQPGQVTCSKQRCRSQAKT